MKKLLPIVAATVLSTSVYAGVDTGLYIGGSVGSYTAKNGNDNTPNFPDFNSGSAVGKGILGYNIGIIPLINVGVEANYVMFNDTDTFKGTTTTLEAVGGINLGPLEVFAKYGVGWNSLKYNSVTIQDGSDPAYGIGASLNLGPVGIRAEYEWLDTGVVDMTYATVGATFTF